MEELSLQELAMSRTLRKQALEIAALTYENEQLKIAISLLKGEGNENINGEQEDQKAVK